MKTRTIAAAFAFVAGAAFAQTTTTTTVQKSLASTLDVHAFPQKGQSSSDQSQDESACYTWAVQNTGTDPFQLQKTAAQNQANADAAKQQAAASTQGTTGRTALRGAAAGTLIGGISGNEGKGAAYGAAAGIIVGNRRKRQAQEQANATVDNANMQSQESINASMESFKKAFSVCLEGKGYLVK
jgi:hypothetical protein